MKEIDTRYGTLKVPVDENDLIAKFLVHYGEWAWDEVTFIASIIPDSARVLDVGACFGTFGIGLSKLRNLTKVCFVDGNAAVIPCLTENVENNIDTETTVWHAIVGRPGLAVTSAHADPENIGSASFAPDGEATSSDVAASQVRSLKEICCEEGPFDLIKIDAEGMELSIIDSHARELARGETALWLECNEDERSLSLCDRVLSWDLEVYYYAFPSHNPDNYRRQEKAIFPFAYEAGLLVAPRQTPVLTDALKQHGCILRRVGSVETLRSCLWHTPRWGYADWQAKTATELAALAGHALRDENYSEFLRHGWRNKTPLTQVRHSLEVELERLASEMQDQKSANQIAISAVMERNASDQRMLVAMEEEKASLRRIIDDMEIKSSRQASIMGDLDGQIRAQKAALTEATSLQAEYAAKIKSLERKVSSLTVEMFDRVAEASRRYEAVYDASGRTRYVYIPSLAEASPSTIIPHQTDRLEFLEHRIRSMEHSTIWRVTAPLRSLISRFPTLHRCIRCSRRVAAKIRDQYRRV